MPEELKDLARRAPPEGALPSSCNTALWRVNTLTEAWTVRGGVMIQPSDEELLAAIATGPGALTEFYRRHVARMTGMGIRRFDNPEDVADFVATVFLEVLGSAG